MTMAVTAQHNNELVVQFDGKTFQCQVIDLEFKRPGLGAGTTVYTACPDGVVNEPGAPTDGTLTGTAYTDTTDTGLWWLLDDAYEADAEISYELTFFPDLGATTAVKFTGRAKAVDSGLGFTKPSVSKHPVNLTIITATKSRPPAA
jgi:hypothetical protein